jgi:hypothetical protein
MAGRLLPETLSKEGSRKKIGMLPWFFKYSDGRHTYVDIHMRWHYRSMYGVETYGNLCFRDRNPRSRRHMRTLPPHAANRGLDIHAADSSQSWFLGRGVDCVYITKKTSMLINYQNIVHRTHVEVCKPKEQRSSRCKYKAVI